MDIYTATECLFVKQALDGVICIVRHLKRLIIVFCKIRKIGIRCVRVN